MTRLHELTPEQLEAWRKARMDAGRERYQDAHLQRYSLVDIVEELLDAINIAELGMERAVATSAPEDSAAYVLSLKSFAEHMQVELRRLQRIDWYTPDALCTDERGGERIYWSEGDAG